MDQSEITRRNEAIAKYMEWVKVTRGPQNFTIWETPDGWNRLDLEFDENWERLMDVVEKILVANPDSLDKMLEVMFAGTFKSQIAGKYGSGESMIEAVFIAVSDYCLSL